MGGSTLHNVVVMSEVALSFVLLVGSGLMFRIFFFNDTATTEIYTLSLHDALPIAARHAGQLEWHEEGGHPAGPARRARAREEHRRLRGHGQADAGLLARDHIALAVALGAAGQVGGVGACPRLGEGEGDDLLAARGGWQPPPLHLLGAVRSHDLARQ